MDGWNWQQSMDGHGELKSLGDSATGPSKVCIAEEADVDGFARCWSRFGAKTYISKVLILILLSSVHGDVVICAGNVLSSFHRGRVSKTMSSHSLVCRSAGARSQIAYDESSSDVTLVFSRLAVWSGRTYRSAIGATSSSSGRSRASMSCARNNRISSEDICTSQLKATDS